jgi:hypothetical protein
MRGRCSRCEPAALASNSILWHAEPGWRTHRRNRYPGNAEKQQQRPAFIGMADDSVAAIRNGSVFWRDLAEAALVVGGEVARTAEAPAEGGSHRPAGSPGLQEFAVHAQRKRTSFS